MLGVEEPQPIIMPKENKDRAQFATKIRLRCFKIQVKPKKRKSNVRQDQSNLTIQNKYLAEGQSRSEAIWRSTYLAWRADTSEASGISRPFAVLDKQRPEGPTHMHLLQIHLCQPIRPMMFYLVPIAQPPVGNVLHSELRNRNFKTCAFFWADCINICVTS